jgi:hypothetical protein
MPFTPDEIPEWFWDIISRAGRSKDKLRELLMTISKDETHSSSNNRLVVVSRQWLKYR